MKKQKLKADRLTNVVLKTFPKTLHTSIPVSQLIPGKYQPRQLFELSALEELAKTIKKVGILEPLLVRPTDTSVFEIIAGERRWRAAQMAALEEVPCVVGPYSDEQAIQISLIENTARQNLNPMEEAEGIANLMATSNYTHEMVALVLGKPRTEITNLLRLRKLDPRVQAFIAKGELSEAHGKILSARSKQEQFQYGEQAIKRGWSSRALDSALKRGEIEQVNQKTQKDDPNLVRLEMKLSEHFGAPVQIGVKGEGGSLKIQFYTLDELEGILEKTGYREE
jgi:ParB family chromosome partitioning protein